MDIPELSFPAYHNHAFLGAIRLPESTDVALTPRLEKLIDHPAFQRLRRVRQLGPTAWIYPGATHVRFEHSIGTYSSVQCFIHTLLQSPDFQDSVQDIDILTILAAGLLHDIGHYPFAHSLEALHHKDSSVETPRHEDLGMRVIAGDLDGVNFLHDHNGNTIGDILRDDWGIDLPRLYSICTGKNINENNKIDLLLRSIISGAIDADKMDYLWRDSLHTGVPYGRHYDRERLLQSITVNGDGSAIAIDAKGRIPAEVFIFGRYMMFSEVYWHHTNRAAAAMVEFALDDLVRNHLHPPLQPALLLSFDDETFLTWLAAQFEECDRGSYLLEGLVHNRRSMYKRVATFSMADRAEIDQQIYQRLYNASYIELDEVVGHLRQQLADETGLPIPPGTILIDTPPRDKDALEAIEVVYSSTRRYPLHEISRIVDGIQHDFIAVAKKIRVFVHPSLAAAVRDLPNLPELLQEVLLAEV